MSIRVQDFVVVAAAVVAAAALASCDRPVDAGPATAPVPADPWMAEATAPTAYGPAAAGAELYAACASCHFADGSGRRDGTVPRLAGQRAAVLTHKLHKLRNGAVTLPVMVPFARGLSDAQITAVAEYIASLPVPRTAPEHAAFAVTQAAGVYAAYCAACHGADGMGSDALMAPRLCNQHALYILRRLEEIDTNQRGDADAAMRAIVAGVGGGARHAVAAWLAAGDCAPPPTVAGSGLTP